MPNITGWGGCAKPNMGIRNKSRSQVRKRWKIVLNQSLIYIQPFPILSPQYFFLFTHLQLSGKKHYKAKKKWRGICTPLAPPSYPYEDQNAISQFAS